ncbi:hypothetical protein F0562_004503 [Nyssa sinensis]|uniref:Uncharacterized protein n=1 Tax=Nyssa sinensis TaxID=561372 RepID=A0A5J5C022_9ASTE|nr:hypothetical protein F0562_004503 [Nyssa sinensis]
MDMQSDFDRLLFFEHARKTAEATYANDPLDADNLTRWGGALIELSQFQNVPDSKKMIQDAISKLEEALLASQYFQQAVEVDPGNELYQKSLEVAAKAPELHVEIHKHGLGQQAMGTEPPSTSSSAKTSKKKNSDLKYDIFGWIILAVGIVAWVGLLQPYLCVAVMVVGLLKSVESTVLIHFDQAPPARSRFSTAVFRYSVVGSNGSNVCKNNGCSIYCELDGQTLRSCPADMIVLKNLTINQKHKFVLNATIQDGERNSSTYLWFIDTMPPTATIFSKQSYTNAEKIAIDVTFSEACTGQGGFKCMNSSNCDVIASGPAHVDASSLQIIKPDIKYNLNVIFSPRSIYAPVVIKMADNFCTDQAGNHFTRTNGSTFIVHLDRRPVQVDLWMSVASYELGINGVPRTVIATNKDKDLEIFLDFSSPIINSTEQILNALNVNSGKLIPTHSRSHGNRRFVFELKNISRTEIISVELLSCFNNWQDRNFCFPCCPNYLPLRFHKPWCRLEDKFTKEVEGGSLTRFEELSRALYSLTVLAISQNVSVIVPAGKVNDISGNLNLASNRLEVKHYSAPIISIALHSFMTVSILATSVAVAILSLSSANLGAMGTLATGGSNMVSSDPSMNLHGMVGHLQVFVLADWLSVSLPLEFSETTKGLRWLLPRGKLPWEKESSSIWPNHLYLSVAKLAAKMSGLSIGFPSHERAYHSYELTSTNISSYPQDGQHNVTVKNIPYGLSLDASEYFTYFLRGEPLSASTVVKRMENYTGWQDLGMNLFWLSVGGASLLIFHILTLVFLRWKTRTSFHGILSVPRFELFLLILMLPCISQSSAFAIRGGTTGGILTGVLLLAIPAGFILSVCLFLKISIFSGSFVQYKEVKHVQTKEPWYTTLWILFTGRPAIGKWFHREGLPSSFLSQFGILFENRKGPPLFVLVDQNDPNSIPKWIESGQSGIGRMRAAGSDDGNEETKVAMSKRLLGCAKSSYIIIDLLRRVGLGIVSGAYSSGGTSQSLFALAITLVQFFCLFTLKPFIRRGVHIVESVSLLSEAGIFALCTSLNGSNSIKESNLGYLMLAFLFLTFVSHIINEWKHWSRIILGSSQPKTGLAPVPPLSPEMMLRGRDTNAQRVDPLSAMTATVVPVLSPGSPGLNAIQMTGSSTAETTLRGQKAGEGKQFKGLKLEPKNEMKKLRELARASFSGGSKYEEGSTSYAL